MRYAIGLDIGVTNVKAAAVSPEGKVRFRRTFETQSHSPDWPGQVKKHLAELEAEHGPAEWIGVAAPGVARADGTSIRWMKGRLGEVQDLDWSGFLGRRAPVLNDAQAALLGEVWQGAGKGVRNAMLLTLGTGVGGAAMVDGRLLRGHLGRAGHLGHICLAMEAEKDIANTPGSLETMIGNYTVEARSGGRFKTTHELVAAHVRGDAEATHVWNRSLTALACGIASLINVLDPEVVIIGGGIAVAGDALFVPLREKVMEREWSLEGEHVRIVPAMLGEFAGAMGAGWNAMVEGSGFGVQTSASSVEPGSVKEGA
jgi:glucokinase